MARACTSCGKHLPGSARFCPECGHPVFAEAASPPRLASPRTNTPKHLADKVLQSRTAIEGERKQITVLFADLKGSMELLTERDPEEARTLLDPVLEHMMEAVHRYEGTVNQVMGDGIMALFGAPLAHEDHAVRACYAALRMQESVRRFAEGARRQEGVLIQIRVGLNSGEVVVRSIGSDLHMDYTAVGQTTHLAARMEQLAAPGSVLVTADTLRLAEGYVQVRSLGPIMVKGLAEPVETYEVTGTGSVRSRLQAGAARGLSRFVGRDAESEQLWRALEQARQGRGQVAAIVGEPGVGKSRLVFELTHSHRVDGWLILESGSVSYGKATSYLPVIDLLKTYFRIGDRDTHRDIREKLTGKIVTLDQDLEADLPALLALLDVPVDDPLWRDLDAPQRRQWTLDAVKRVLLREAQVQPVLLVIEDLHWLDAESQALLDSLIESLPTVRVLVVVNYRPEYDHAWGGKTYYAQLDLDPLPPEGAGELLEALLGRDASLEPLKELLARKTGGNPLFIEEGVRTLVETKALLGERGTYRLAQPVEALQVPATVQAILASRIDRLPPEPKRLLETAAVIGKDVPFVLLQAIAGTTDEELDRSLAHLQFAEFLYEVDLLPELEYTFKHALTHEVAYQGLLHERRRALHGRIVEAIERLYPDRLVEHVEGLAHHAERGGVWRKAVLYYRAAGRKAADRSAHREAAAFFEHALAALRHLPSERETIQLAVDLRFDLKTSLTPLDEWGKIFECLREATDLAEVLGDRHRLGRVSAYTSDCARAMGNYDLAIEAGQRALTIAEALQDFTLRINTNIYLGLAYFFRGDGRRAVEFFRTNMRALTGDLVRERSDMPQFPAVHSRALMAWCVAELGEFSEGLAASEEGLLIATSLGHPLSVIIGRFGVGQLRLQRGDFAEAVRELEHGLELGRARNLQLWSLNIAAALGSAYARSGRVAEGVELLEKAVERSAAMRRLGFHSMRVASLAEAYLLAGRTNDALAFARRALDLAREHKERGVEAWTLHHLGEIASERGSRDLDHAAGHYGAALAIAEELGMRPLEARCRLGLGRLSRWAESRAKGEPHLVAAAALFTDMGMRFWLEQAEAELSALR